MDRVQVLDLLNNSKGRLIQHLNDVIKVKDFNYRTFGTEIEKDILAKVMDILRESGYSGGFSIAETKNDFPDLTVLIKPKIAIEIKAGRRFKYSRKKKKWVKCLNSNNDLGTLNKWPDHLEEFGGENIFYIFIEYNFQNSTKEIVNIEIESFYKFIGKNKDGFLRYREKDGNLRPKNFGQEQQVASLEEFQRLVPMTSVYRSKRIISKHKKIAAEILRSMSEEDKKSVLAFFESNQLEIPFDSLPDLP